MRVTLSTLLAIAPIAAGCMAGEVSDPGPKPYVPLVRGGYDGLTEDEAAALRSMSPLPALPPDPTNAHADDPRAAELGHLLVFDRALSGPPVDGAVSGAGVACWSCHSSPALDDETTGFGVSHGTGWTPRNALTLLNSSYYAWAGWGGKFDSQWSLALSAIENPKVMNGSRLAVLRRIFDAYPGPYAAAFGEHLPVFTLSSYPPSGKPKASPSDPDGPWESLTPAQQAEANHVFVNAGKAIGAYLRKLVSGEAPFDRWAAGDTTAIGSSAKNGFRLFVGKAGCVSCHSGPLFTDGAFHNTGVQQSGTHVPAEDLGRFTDAQQLLASPWNGNGPYSDDRTTGKIGALVPNDAMRGQWRTKSLRNLSGSGPFMHAGQIGTLEEAVAYEASGGVEPCSGGALDPKFRRVHLEAAEIADLVAFLGSLEGAKVDGALRSPPPEAPPASSGGW